jgi:hypothetical protein
MKFGGDIDVGGDVIRVKGCIIYSVPILWSTRGQIR